MKDDYKKNQLDSSERNVRGRPRRSQYEGIREMILGRGFPGLREMNIGIGVEIQRERVCLTALLPWEVDAMFLFVNLLNTVEFC